MKRGKGLVFFTLLTFILIISLLVVSCETVSDEESQDNWETIESNGTNEINDSVGAFENDMGIQDSNETDGNIETSEYLELEFEQDENCEKPIFTEYFANPNFIQKVGQIGYMHGSGQHLVGRSYVSFNENAGEVISVYAPVDMILESGTYHQNADHEEEALPDYVLNFNAGCKVTVRFDHLKDVVESISSQLTELKEDSRTFQLEPVEFKAGDEVGYFIQNVGVAGMDFLVQDEDVTNQFVNQERQEFEYGSLLLHAVCPYDFYEEDKKAEYYALIGGASGTIFENKECGPINRDIEGTISGQWFLEEDVTSWLYDYYMEGSYGSSFPIIGDEEKVTLGKIGEFSTISIYSSYPTYKLPKDVTDEHCYQIHPTNNPSEWDGYVYLKLENNEEIKGSDYEYENVLLVYYGESGDCPSSFPTSGYETYYR